jgi:hypothetical protein
LTRPVARRPSTGRRPPPRLRRLPRRPPPTATAFESLTPAP